MPSHSSPRIPVSWGELLDKITILQIKRERIADRTARENVSVELAQLREVATQVLQCGGVAPLLDRLKAINEGLWDIEDAIRREEARARFGPEFIGLARSVYRQNDRRAALKREINELLKSELVEEKSYWPAVIDA